MTSVARGTIPRTTTKHFSPISIDQAVSRRIASARSSMIGLVAIQKRIAMLSWHGYKGVILCRKSGRWHAFIRSRGRRTYLGSFPTPEAGHAAYVAAARKLFGEFARPE
jgi:hypothetical protein